MSARVEHLEIQVDGCPRPTRLLLYPTRIAGRKYARDRKDNFHFIFSSFIRREKRMRAW